MPAILKDAPATAPEPAPAQPPPARKPKPVIQTATAPRKIVYPEVKSVLYLAGNEKGPITAALAKKLMGWDTEMEFTARLMAQNKELTAEMCAFWNAAKKEWAIEPLLKNEDGEYVVCHNNIGNREFKEERCMSYVQDILSRKWADSRNGENMTINGESIILTATGRVDSGQKRLAAVARAAEKWHKNPKKYPLWQEEPSIEGLIVAGVSENPLVTQTIDNVDPRTLEDVLCTSHAFAGLKTTQEKRESGRMLSKAIDALWARTGAGESNYQTHSASLDFLNRHKKLERFVRHIFEENKNRGISLLRLSPGEMAAACWLMASGKSDGDVYRNMDPPKESKLDWAYQDKAENFFVELVLAARNKGADKKDLGALGEVVWALAGLTEDKTNLDKTGLGGRKVEKLAILARAWTWWKDATPNAVLPKSVVKLEYHKDAQGDNHLLPDVNGFLNDFGGVDIGEKPAGGKKPADAGDDPADADDMEARKKGAKGATARGETPAETQARIDANKAKLAENRAARKAAGLPTGTGKVSETASSIPTATLAPPVDNPVQPATPTVPAPKIGGKKK